MYKIKNGILEKDSKKIFCVGQSYYPSFHKAKYPVPPEGDRIGEMKKDLKIMHEMGFNHVRYAAIGDVALNDENALSIDTPFVDAMIKEADKNDMSVSVRLEGYVVNMHDYKDVLMLDHQGIPQDPSIWYDFIQCTLHHEGLNADNVFHAQEMAKYYKKFDNMVGYQIYNEPHYPGEAFFDYHEGAINAYRTWLVENGILSEEESKTYEPPRSRKEQSPAMWALWRIFTRDSLTNFLASAGIAARNASGLPVYTCYTADQGSKWAPFRGVDYYGGAKTMDIAGYTIYIHAEGYNYYTMALICDMNYAAARLSGRTTWCIELDSRTKIPPRIFNKNTYAVLGSGAKGILYYQWRGDYPSEATPIPNGCGLVNYDGSKTPNFENASMMVRFINRMSDYLVNSEPANSQIGILHADYSVFYCDAQENDKQLRDESIHNSCITDIARMYYEVRKAGFFAFVVPPEALEENRLRLKLLFVPQAVSLWDRDRAYIEKFIGNGGIVYEYVATSFESGYQPYGRKQELYKPFMEFEDLVRLHNMTPFVKSDNPNAALQLLEHDGCKLIVITNISCHERTIKATIQCSFNFTTAILCSSCAEDQNLITDGNKIIVDEITDGGIIIVI